MSQHKPFLCNFKINKVKVSRRKFVTKTKLHERYGNYMKTEVEKGFFSNPNLGFFHQNHPNISDHPPWATD